MAGGWALRHCCGQSVFESYHLVLRYRLSNNDRAMLCYVCSIKVVNY